MEAYYNDMISMELGESARIHASEDFDLAQAIQIHIPSNTSFTQIYVLVTVMNPEVANEGLELYVNWGLPGKV